MLLTEYRRQRGVIHPTHPINWSHPLNRGRVFWGLIMPRRNYSNVWWDVTNMTHVPTRTATVSSDWNKGTVRPGGWGRLQCTVADAGARITAPTRLRLALPHTLAIWYRSFGTPTANSFFVGATYDSVDNNPYIAYGILDSGGNAVAYMGNSAGTFYLEAASPTISWSGMTNWTRVVIVATAAARRFYVNGVYQSEATTARSSPTYGSGAYFNIGEGLSNTRSMNGWCDDPSVWDRALTDQEVLADYKLGVNGYPGVLRRITRRMSPEQAAAATGNPWYYYSLLRG